MAFPFRKSTVIAQRGNVNAPDCVRSEEPRMAVTCFSDIPKLTGPSALPGVINVEIPPLTAGIAMTVLRT